VLLPGEVPFKLLEFVQFIVKKVLLKIRESVLGLDELLEFLLAEAGSVKLDDLGF
jgi:hypothetical protein